MLATTVAGSALAQDEPAPFTGAHIEAIVGHDNVGGGSGGREGFAYGIGAGYDFQVRGAVLGIEGEASDRPRGQGLSMSLFRAIVRATTPSIRAPGLAATILTLSGQRRRWWPLVIYRNKKLLRLVPSGVLSVSPPSGLRAAYRHAGRSVAPHNRHGRQT
jgi:hypothetical protein